MGRDVFDGYHPIVNIIYFASVIGFAMFFDHPVCLVISLACALSYSLYIGGKKALRFTLVYMLPLLLFTALINPAFNHRGVTILTYLPGGNPLTLESILYGIAAATMLVTVITWFSCFNSVITSDKLVYLLGRLTPSLSMVLAMALRFVPRYKAQLEIISKAHRCLGRDESSGGFIQRFKTGIKIRFVMVGWALENAVETADSTRGRGYGLPGRTAFAIYRFDRRDAYALAYIMACVSVILVGAMTEVYRFRYFPSMRGQWGGLGTVAVFLAYLLLGAFPTVINVKDDMLWRSIESRI